MEMKLRMSDKVTLVDEDDFIRFNGFNWYLKEDGCVITDSAKPRRQFGVPVKLFLHRLITLAPPGKDVDHKNGNKLDNRKSNLRICTRSQNLTNRGLGHAAKHSKMKGVYYRPYSHFKKRKIEAKKKWFSTITVDGKTKYLGSFYTQEEAFEAHKQASLKYHGEFSFYRREQK